MKWIKYLFLATASLVLAIGCASQQPPSEPAAQNSPAAPRGENVVNLYSARHYDTDRVLYDNFTKETGIQVNLVEGKEDELIERIKSEAANSPADVFITVDAGRLWRAQEAGILQPIESEILESKVPEYLRDPEGRWFGLSKRARVIIYNQEKVDPAELSTYEDLANPKWKGRIIVRSSSNIYNQSLVGAILAEKGAEQTEEWVKGLVANFARPPEGNDVSQIKSVAEGVADLAIVNSYYVARLANSDDPEDRAVVEKIGLFFPNQGDRGTHVNISGAGVVVTAPHKENAIAFLEYLVTPEAQTIFAKGNNEFPVVEGAKLDNPFLEQYVPFKEDDVNAGVVGKNNAEALQIMDRAGWK
ncbi:MAG TPA: Fe(3+) ABC transporter substrate-binding protein [Oscillatoriales cyanobacterium M59_W2019_021]|nr:MAG: Fe(3+) ABC transporter substrate-binding protein [Cyanobacteria bacterium J055]HIK32001.1 Fe(3+) ABC transporter substrate-binding protein [Oscillatoriales cyanobacterium M4454_W2019_049]HIK49481.1 Fe(3+) ABC transporter substrate-binding protein [Oscillatoriales cyanobacterium M59_W2019_021]